MTRFITTLVLTTLLVGCGGVKSLVSKTRDVVTPAATQSAGLVPATGAASARKLWERDTGSGNAGKDLDLVPAVSGERIYVADARGQVSAYDGAGQSLWSKNLKAPISGATAAGAGLVLIGTMDGELIALKADSGEPAWRSQLSSEILSPAVAGSQVVVARTVDGKVFGLDAADGHQIWIYERGVPSLTLRGTAASVLAGDQVLTGFASGKLVANELASGRVMWEASIGLAHGRNELERLIDVDSRPVVYGASVYSAAYQGKVVALSLADGSSQWDQKVSTYHDIAVDENYVYVSDEKDRVVALNRSTGAEAWAQTALSGRGLGAPLLVGRWLVVVDGEGLLHLLNTSDGSLAGRLSLDRKDRDARAESAGGRLYLLNGNGDLTAIDIGS